MDNLSADAAHDPETRDILRTRTRYEVANNPVAAGMLHVLVDETVGTGPRLQVISDIDGNGEADTAFVRDAEALERRWDEWFQAIGGVDKLQTCRRARAASGETFGLIGNNPIIGEETAIPLDWKLIEADQVETPDLPPSTPEYVSGIQFDSFGNPMSYDVLDAHPGDLDAGASAITYDTIDRIHPRMGFVQVLHYFRPTREGQHRGIPELVPSLLPLAELRAYKAAVRAAAETAANLSLMLKVEETPNLDDFDPYEPLESLMRLEAGSMITLPENYDVKSFQGTQPTTTLEAFERSCIREIARALSMPYNVAAGDSNGLSFSAARTDLIPYRRAIRVERQAMEQRILRHLFRAWLTVARLVEGDAAIPQRFREGSAPSIRWQWPGFEPLDRLKEANADAVEINNGITTRTRIQIRNGEDPAAIRRELTLEREFYGERATTAGVAGGAEARPSGESDGEGEEDSQVDSVSGNLADLLCASGSASSLLMFSSGVEIAAASEGASRISIVAYTGGRLEGARVGGRLAGARGALYVDLEGVSIPDRGVPILRDHDQARPVGHAARDGITAAGELRLDAELSIESSETAQITASARRGFPWQASIGGVPRTFRQLQAGQTDTVNGRDVRGPAVIVTAFDLREVSLVTVGADARSVARLAAAHSRGRKMEFEAWLSARGFDIESLSQDQTDTLRAAYDAEQQRENDDDNNAPDVDAERVRREVTKQIGDSRLRAAAEFRRQDKIRTLCADDHLDIAAEAIQAGWSEERTELELLKREKSPKAPHAPSKRRPGSDNGRADEAAALEASLCMSLGLSEDDLAKDMGAEVVEAARKKFPEIGLRDLSLAAARLDGESVGVSFGHGDHLEAAFAGKSLPALTGNALNRAVLAAYGAVPTVAMSICSIRSTRDYREVSQFRTITSGRFDAVNTDGELTSSTVKQSEFKNQAETYGTQIKLSHKDVQNDDIGVIAEMARDIGHAGRETIDYELAKIILANGGSPAFFSTGNNNLITGATSALGQVGLTKTRERFLKQKSTTIDGKTRPLNIRPEILLVPPELEMKAIQELGGPLNMAGTSGTVTEAGSRNPHAGMYRILMMPHLSDSTINSNASATAYYLMANPALVAAYSLVFLNGRREPRIERIDNKGSDLAIKWNAVINFGVAAQDPVGAVKAAGS